MASNLRLPFEGSGSGGAGDRWQADREARAFAVDPSRNVVLEASAGTGKTRVLVDRYLNLLRARVDPANILAITFTRKAAAEMRQRIVERLREDAALSPEGATRWRELRDRLGEIAISTIDAFCLALLREFPLEADLDPGFDVADETQVVRLTEEAIDRALRISRGLAVTDKDLGVVFAQLRDRKLRAGLASLVGRRLVAEQALSRVVSRAPRDLTAERACRTAVDRLRGLLESVPGGLTRFLEDGPRQHPRYALFASDVRRLSGGDPNTAGEEDWAVLRAAIDRVRDHFLKGDGAPRARLARPYLKEHCPSREAFEAHQASVKALAPLVADALHGFRRDVNAVVSRGVWRAFQVALTEYSRGLEAEAVVDFPALLERALALVGRMDEFAQSRYRLEARYHHVLVDEFQDTSRAQWRLVSLLIKSWGEGLGLAHEAPLPPSIFVVGDRKQSIYAFRDAAVAVIDEAAGEVDALRAERGARRTISRSFRAVPELLAFTNDLFAAVPKVPDRHDRFRYDETDRFPVDPAEPEPSARDALGVVVTDDERSSAAAVAAEIERLLGGETVRDRQTGAPRAARPGDIAILFRTRETHREFEAALQARAVPSYVYKGLGFFDADEIRDVVALLQYLADPVSDLRAAALLRSRFVRLSDPALKALAPELARVLRRGDDRPGLATLDEEDRAVLGALRAALPGWLALVDRLPPAELLDRVIDETAYAFEIRGPRRVQARENVKKLRALVRRIQNRGYATLERIAEHLGRLSAGDESNAVVDALDAVNLMTIHAAKGLEFPIVFVVNLGRGSGGRRDAVRVTADDGTGQPAVSVGDFLSTADEDTRPRDIEETKRLLYVAVTRARDRLYLASLLKDGVLPCRAGSLAEVLPADVRRFLASAGPSCTADRLEWTAASGTRHRFRVCRPPPGEAAPRVAPAAREREPRDLLWPIRDESPIRRMTASERAAETASSAGERTFAPPVARDRSALVGTLVHRMFRAHRPDGPPEVEDVKVRMRELMSRDELGETDDPDALAAEAAATFLALAGRPDIVSLLAAGQCLYEVPFSLRLDGAHGSRQSSVEGCQSTVALPSNAGPEAAAREPEATLIVRGAIDCLVLQPDGQVTVLEFKTGAERPEHRLQLDLYVQAARALLPGRRVEGLLVYAGSP